MGIWMISPGNVPGVIVIGKLVRSAHRLWGCVCVHLDLLDL